MMANLLHNAASLSKVIHVVGIPQPAPSDTTTSPGRTNRSNGSVREPCGDDIARRNFEDGTKKSAGAA